MPRPDRVTEKIKRRREEKAKRHQKFKKRRRPDIKRGQIQRRFAKQLKNLKKVDGHWQIKIKVNGRDVLIRNPDRRAAMHDMAVVMGFNVIEDQPGPPDEPGPPNRPGLPGRER